ncbi:hypothetical protein [Paraburkholderia sediminicola]
MKKDASLIAHDYHPDFVLETNGQKQNYDAFAEGHPQGVRDRCHLRNQV